MKKILFFVLIIAVLTVGCLVGCGSPEEEITVTLNKEQVVIKKIGGTEQLTAKVSNDGAVVWASLDEEIATVTQEGLVTALSNGVTQITATSGGVTAVCTVEVNEPIIPEPGLIVSFSKTSASLNASTGETYTLVPNVLKNNQPLSEGVTLEWSSSAPEKASVVNGLVTALSTTEQGVPVVITCRATYGEEWAEARFYVTVKDDIDILFLTEQTKFYTTDAEIALPVSVKINGVETSVIPEYSSSDVSVAKVVAGKILPVGAGEVTIFANVNGEVKSYQIIVKQKFFVSNAQEFMNISKGSDKVTYELTQNIELTNANVQTMNIGGTAIKTAHTYFVDSFKGELIGNGYTVKYVYTAPYDGVNVTSDRFIGLFKNIESTALIRETAFVGEVTFDYPHQIAFAQINEGVIENCFIRTARRQLTSGTGWQAHYNVAGSMFETQHGTIKDSVVYGEFFAGGTTLSDSGDNIVSYGTKNFGRYDNVAFISKFSRIGNHSGANWSSAMGKDEFVNFVYYPGVEAFIAKEGQRITNPNDSSKYAEYVRTDCNDQTFDSSIWQMSEEYLSINGRKVWEKGNVTLNRQAIALVDNVSETFTLVPTTDHADKRFTYTSLDSSVATVNAEGKVEFVGAGQCNIVAKHFATSQTALLKVYAYSSVTEVNTKDGLLNAMRTSTASTAISLTGDVEITQSDFIEVVNENAQAGAVKQKFAYAVESFKGAIIGNSHKISWQYNDSTSFVAGDQTTYSDIYFKGVIQNLESTALIIDTIIEGESVIEGDGQPALISNVYGTIESCYINSVRRQLTSGSGNWNATAGTFEKNEGLIANCIIVSDAYKAGITRDSAKLVYKGDASKGEFKNVALVQFGGKNVGTRNGANNNGPLYDSHMQGLVWYSSLSEIAEEKGQLVTNKDRNMVYEYEEYNALQNLGSAWTINQTTDDEYIKLGNVTIWQKVVMVDDEADFISKASSAQSGTVLKLSKDLTFDSDDFTVVDNGATGTKTKDAYIVETLNAKLLGDGHKISWYYNKSTDFVQGDNSTISEESFCGVFKTVGQGSVISNVLFVGETVVDLDEQPAFISTLNGKIENCYIDVVRRQLRSGRITDDGNANWQAAGGLIKANEGTINSCVIWAKGLNGSTSTTDAGAKLVFRGTTAGRFTNIAYISADKKIANRNGANENSYLLNEQMDNFVYYASLANLVNATGSEVTNPDGAKYVFVDYTEAQNIGSAWTIDQSGIKLYDKYVYNA